MSLEDIRLNEVNQAQKDNCCLFSLTLKRATKADLLELESTIVITRDFKGQEGGGNGERLVNGYRKYNWIGGITCNIP